MTTRRQTKDERDFNEAFKRFDSKPGREQMRRNLGWRETNFSVSKIIRKAKT